jgi:hypothetical protein
MSKLTCNTSLSLAKTTWQLYVARQDGAQAEKPPFLKTRLAQAHEIFTGRLGQGLSGAGFGPARLWNTPWVTQFGLGLWSPSLVWAFGHPARSGPWVTQFGLGLWSPSLVWAFGHPARSGPWVTQFGLGLWLLSAVWACYGSELCVRVLGVFTGLETGHASIGVVHRT